MQTLKVWKALPETSRSRSENAPARLSETAVPDAAPVLKIVPSSFSLCLQADELVILDGKLSLKVRPNQKLPHS
jgi:hypothetical protein